MSIIHITNPATGEALRNVSCVTLNQHNPINLPSRNFVATPPTPIPRFEVSGFLFNGATFYGKQPSSIVFYAYLAGGILGNCFLNIASQNLITVYYSTKIPVDGTGIIALTLAQLIALPNTASALSVYISSDGTCNTTIVPLCLDFIY